MNILSIYTFTAILISVLFLSACSKSSSSDSDEFEDGVRIEIIDILGEENLKILENDLKMPINRGQNPPDINSFFNSVVLSRKNANIGVGFVMSPLTMIETLVPGDEDVDPNSFWDLYFRFKDQNMNNFTITFENRHIQEPNGASISSYIIGEDDLFTVAGEIVRVLEEGSVRTVQLISGRLTEDGIADAHYSFIMVDNGGVDGIVDNGTGRTFIDAAGISVLADYPEDEESTAVKNQNGSFSYWDLFRK